MNLVTLLLLAPPILIALTFHEFAHAYAAYRHGDDTAKQLGRLSLNPLRHLDPLGTIMIFLVHFGWAKPVPVNFSHLRDRRMGMVLVSAAGITANMLLAFGALLLTRLLSPAPSSMPAVRLHYFAQINIILAAFNLIPLPPLDGSKILMGFASPKVQTLLLRMERYGFFIIIGLLYFGVLNPVIDFFRWMLSSFINLLLS